MSKITRESPSPNTYEKIIAILYKSFEFNDVDLMNVIYEIKKEFVPLYIPLITFKKQCPRCSANWRVYSFEESRSSIE